MSYCTLEEAWGSDFKKQKRKSKKEKKLEKEEQQMLQDSIDPHILIPETHRLADYRKSPPQQPQPDTSMIGGYDSSFDSYISPYQRYRSNPVQQMNETVLAQNRPTPSLSTPIKELRDDVIQLTRKEYESLKKEVVEGFGTTTDDQFNQLILYIFTGIFYLLMLDMMYQLGKKSY